MDHNRYQQQAHQQDLPGGGGSRNNSLQQQQGYYDDPNSFANNNESFASFADPSVPLVPVAAAPKDDTLYDSLLRYHNENDSTSTDDSDARRRRRNPKVTPYSANNNPPNTRVKSSDDDMTVESDQKLPALSIPTKKPPPPASSSNSPSPPGLKAPPPSMTAVVNRKKPPPSSTSNQSNNLDGSGHQNRGSFYKAAFAATGMSAKPKSPAPSKKPGVVHVSEPGMRPDSAMYQAAYGSSQPHPQNKPSPFAEAMGVHDVRDTLKMLQKQRGLESKRQMMGLVPDNTEFQHLKDPNNRNIDLNAGSSHSTRTYPPAGPPRNRSVDSAMVIPGGGGAIPPDMLRNTSSGGSNPHSHMMNIGNFDEHIGLPKTKQPRDSKSPTRMLPKPQVPNFFQKRPSADKPTPHDDSSPASTARKGPPPAWYTGDQHRGGGGGRPSNVKTYNDNSLNSLSTHSGEYSSGVNNNNNAVGGGRGGYPNRGGGIPNNHGYASPRAANIQPQQQHRGYPMNASSFPMDEPSLAEQSQSTAESSMDEELRLALEISKQDTGTPGVAKPRLGTVAAAAAAHPTSMSKQTSFGRDAMAHARGSSHSSITDLMLALKLSAEESSSSQAAATSAPKLTSLDELLAFEMAQDNNQSMTDFVAAGITATPAAAPASSTLKSAPTAATPLNKDQDEQLRILERIREEQEQREIEMALKASQQESARAPSSKPGAVTMNRPANYLYSQQKAMEDWSQPGFMHGNNNTADVSSSSATVKARPGAQRENSMSSINSEGRRRELLERGTSETKIAIQSGQAHVVVCRGCGGRLQAPVSYSLVFCPKCQTISPA